ncbi:tetratricopeptide repeat protein [Roseobacter litoralis]|uniref:tetratricopeptide repeat protein n=1 Tax=Roseobacter litoralis TaxID=42443 RepID=UPI0013052889|nr:tetratricopeptide repeat protein [Roseobacter litoralis]
MNKNQRANVVLTLLQEAMLRFLASVILYGSLVSFAAADQSSSGDCSPNVDTTGDVAIECNFGDSDSSPVQLHEISPEIATILENYESTNDAAGAVGELTLVAKRTPSPDSYALAYYYAAHIEGWLGNLNMARYFLDRGDKRLPMNALFLALYSNLAFEIGYHTAAYRYATALFGEMAADPIPKQGLLSAAEVSILSGLKIGKVKNARTVFSELSQATSNKTTFLDENRARFDLLEARVLFAEGNSEAALRLAENALTAIREQYGSDHFEAAKAMFATAEINFDAGRYVQAAQLSRSASNTALFAGQNPNGFHGKTSKLATKAYMAAGERNLSVELAKHHYSSTAQFQSLSDEAIFEAASFAVESLERLGRYQDAAEVLAHAFSLKSDPTRILGTDVFLNVPYLRIVAKVSDIRCAPPHEHMTLGLRSNVLESLIALRSQLGTYIFLEESIEALRADPVPSEMVTC